MEQSKDLSIISLCHPELSISVILSAAEGSFSETLRSFGCAQDDSEVLGA